MDSISLEPVAISQSHVLDFLAWTYYQKCSTLLIFFLVVLEIDSNILLLLFCLITIYRDEI
jgi:hypothetical protein